MAKTRIRQHDYDLREKKLYDMVDFLTDIDEFFSVEQWQINIEWCTTAQGWRTGETKMEARVYSDAEFRQAYADVRQTIDGLFIIESATSVVATLTAVDSSFWIVESADQTFVAHMESKYGVYRRAGVSD